MPVKPEIQPMISARDVEGLIRALRYPADAEVRAHAAKGLAALHDTRATESLIRSTLEDPDEAVQKAASQALAELLGSQTAQNALDAFFIEGSDDRPWISEQEQPDSDTEVAHTATGWRLEDIGGLIAVLTNEPSSELKIKAIRALRDVHNTRALDVLGLTALWDEDERVQQAARETLEGFYGDELPAVLESLRSAESDQTEDEQEFEEGFDPFQGAKDRRPSAYDPHQQPKTGFSPAVQEDDPARKFLLLLLILAVIAGIVFFFLFR